MHRTLGTPIRWLAAAALIAGALGYAAPGHALPFKRLFVFLNRTGPAGCANDASGNPYYANATGSTNTLSTVCNAGSTGSTAQTSCDNTAVWHTVSLERLQINGLMFTISNSPTQKTWTNIASTPAFNIPSHASCPAGNTATGTSFGRTFNL